MSHLSHRARIPALALALTLALGACAGGGAAPGPMPEPSPGAPGPAVPESGIGPADELAPSSSSINASRNVELTGQELGRMWLFENPPLEYWREEYGFEPDEAWLEHVRLASVRYGEVCSASFVSPDGLVMTNHHCARECIEAVATEEVDYVEEGFYAATREEELVCPDLWLDQLEAIEDVTERVSGVAPEGAPDTVVSALRDSVTEAIEEACGEAGEGIECEVVDLYHGGKFHLYRYRRYEPVKLVFAPDLDAGQFGGDPDNFTYPRYNLDVSFVRAYQADSATALETPHYFPWDEDGAADGEAVFITGNPGSTNRLRTVAQLMYMQRYGHPFQVQYLQGIVDFLRLIADQGRDAERAVREDLATFENGLKAFEGELDGLRDTLLIGQKIKWENAFRRQVMADETLAGRAGGAWDRIAGLQREKIGLEQRHTIYDFNLIGDPHTQLAGMLVQYVRQSALPEERRREGFDDAALDSIRGILTQQTPYSPEVGARLLAIRLELARDWLPEDDPVMRIAFRGPDDRALDAARRLVYGSQVADVRFRRDLMDRGRSAVTSSQDPMVRLAVAMDEAYPELDGRMEELEAAEGVQEEKLAAALFPVFGDGIPPDATFTLRITDGRVARYPYNGTVAAPFTSFYGLYARSNEFNGEDPWDLHRRWIQGRNRIDMATYLNFVATTDITGGNSGSPMIDRYGRVVGAAFDGNIESLPNDFVYRTTAARTVGVHSAGILEALRAIYQADALVAEIVSAMNPD